MKSLNTRYVVESIIVLALCILILILMICGSANAQNSNPVNIVTDSLIRSSYMTAELPPNSDGIVKKMDRNVDLTGAKIFVLDEEKMVELMLQDDKIARMMTAAVIKAIGNDVRLYKMIMNDGEICNPACLHCQTKCKKSEDTVSCECCRQKNNSEQMKTFKY